MGRDNEKKEKIVFIGYGKVSSSIGKSIEEQFSIYYVSRHRKGENFLELEFALSNFSNFFISRKDDEIATTIDELIKYELEKKVFLTFSGAIGSPDLKPLEEKGAMVGSLHPVYPFTKFEEELKGKGVTFFYEGAQEGRVLSEKIVEQLNGRIFEIDKEKKLIYHAILTLYGNYPFYLLKLAKEVAEREFGKEKAIQIIKASERLFIESFESFKRDGKISGPLERGDFKLLEKEIKNFPEKESFRKVVDLAKTIKKK